MKTSRISALALAVALAAIIPAFVTTPAWAETQTPTNNIEQKIDVQPTAPTKVADDAARYAKRESKAKKQADYQGGSAVVVVGVTTTSFLVVLLIVLILL